MKKYVCSNCGSDQVEITAWIDANTKDIKSMSEEESWCRNCKSQVELEERDFKSLLLSEVERKTIMSALVISKFRRNRAAKLLGISERTLYRRIKEYADICTTRH